MFNASSIHRLQTDERLWVEFPEQACSFHRNAVELPNSSRRPWEKIHSVDSLLHHHANINATDKWGRTPPYLAATYGRSEIVQSLLQEEADAKMLDKWGNAPIALASAARQKEMIDLLLNCYSNVTS